MFPSLNENRGTVLTQQLSNPQINDIVENASYGF
jgi:hypothetical protein